MCLGRGFMSRGDSGEGYVLDKPRCRQDSVRNSSPYTTHYIASVLFSIIPINPLYIFHIITPIIPVVRLSVASLAPLLWLAQCWA